MENWKCQWWRRRILKQRRRRKRKRLRFSHTGTHITHNDTHAQAKLFIPNLMWHNTTQHNNKCKLINTGKRWCALLQIIWTLIYLVPSRLSVKVCAEARDRAIRVFSALWRMTWQLARSVSCFTFIASLNTFESRRDWDREKHAYTHNY